jgi:hypothetical protein
MGPTVYLPEMIRLPIQSDYFAHLSRLRNLPYRVWDRRVGHDEHSGADLILSVFNTTACCFQQNPDHLFTGRRRKKSKKQQNIRSLISNQSTKTSRRIGSTNPPHNHDYATTSSPPHPTPHIISSKSYTPPQSTSPDSSASQISGIA